jgi:hypothetical protein
MDLEHLDRLLPERLDALGPAPAAEHRVLMLPDPERADRIGEFWGYPQSRAFADLLIDCEEEPAARAVVFGLLAEMERSSTNQGVGIVPEVRSVPRAGRLARRAPRAREGRCTSRPGGSLRG